MNTLVRFAPSPTGYLHPGNARVALQNYLFSYQREGHFLLRMDDTDTQRSKQEFVEGIIEDLTWLGITPSRIIYQSQRLHLYSKAQQTLQEKGLLYPCYETPEELEEERRLLRKIGKPPIYSRKSYHLSENERKEKEAQGIRPHWRFLLPDKTIEWQDLCKGKRSIHLHNASDPILMRADGSLTFLLASVVDDIAENVTHIIRGEDHIPNTAIHIALEQALTDRKETSFIFAHTTLLHAQQGSVLSKSEGSCSLKVLRNQGILPFSLGHYILSLGASATLPIGTNITDLKDSFSLEKYSHSSPLFDLHQLTIANKRALHNTPYDALPTSYQRHCSPELWKCISANTSSLDDLLNFTKALTTPQASQLDTSDKDFISTIIALLEKEKTSDWEAFWQNVQNVSNRKGKKLFLPIRLALTGLSYGPEIPKCSAYLGHEKTLNLLKRAVQQ